MSRRNGSVRSAPIQSPPHPQTAPCHANPACRFRRQSRRFLAMRRFRLGRMRPGGNRCASMLESPRRSAGSRHLQLRSPGCWRHRHTAVVLASPRNGRCRRSRRLHRRWLVWLGQQLARLQTACLTVPAARASRKGFMYPMICARSPCICGLDVTAVCLASMCLDCN